MTPLVCRQASRPNGGFPNVAYEFPHRRRSSPGQTAIATPHHVNQPASKPRDKFNAGARTAISGLVRVLVDHGVSPNAITLVGFTLVVASVPFAMTGQWFMSFLLFTIGGLTDLLDGSVARLAGKSTRFGAFLDSSLDRLAEGIVLGGLGIVFAKDDDWWALSAAFLALTVSFLVSYTRARAEGLGITSNKGGLMSRTERLILLGAGMFFTTWFDRVMSITVIILAVLTTVTVVQRMVHVWRELRDDEPMKV